MRRVRCACALTTRCVRVFELLYCVRGVGLDPGQGPILRQKPSSDTMPASCLPVQCVRRHSEC
eukprot:1174885-Prymnesium_polylepis.1